MPGFRETMLAYFAACHQLGQMLHRAFAIDLGLPPDFFADKLDRPMAVLRLLHYPPAPSRLSKANSVPASNRLWLRHAARHRWGGRAGGAHARRRVAEGAACRGRVRLQHRRLPDALDERHLRLDAASRRQPGGQGALFDRLLPRSQPGCRHRLPPGLRHSRAAARYQPIKGDAFLLSRLSPTYEKSGLGLEPAQARTPWHDRAAHPRNRRSGRRIRFASAT